MIRIVMRCLLVLIWIAILQPASAAKYEILFEEGAFRYDPNSDPNDVDNKYLTRVTVKKDGNVLATDIRGSTLPDAWVFYRRWNVELKQTNTPSDTDIVTMFQYFEKQTGELRDSNARLGGTRLADIADILDVLNRVPAIKTGNYPFVMGLHKSGKSKHGHPYAPRLLGGPKGKPFDPTDSNSTATTVGGFIRTLNKNNAQGQSYLADGINVHDGRTNEDYKDSEGCLTIRPQDWKKFYESLSSPEDWIKYNHVGVVSVSRPVPPQAVTIPAPQNLRVQ